MNNITAYIKEATPVSAHEDIVGAIPDPVKVVSIDGQGAQVVEGLPAGRVVIYDLVEYDEVERVEYQTNGHVEIEEGVWVETFERIVHIDKVPRIETYAVAVEEPSTGEPDEIVPEKDTGLRK